MSLLRMASLRMMTGTCVVTVSGVPVPARVCSGSVSMPDTSVTVAYLSTMRVSGMPAVSPMPAVPTMSVRMTTGAVMHRTRQRTE